MADHVLSGYARVSFNNPIDVLPSLDRNMSMTGGGKVALKLTDTRVDANIEASFKGKVGLNITPKTDVNVASNAYLNAGVKVEGGISRDIAHRMSSNITEPALDFSPGVDKGLEIKSDLKPGKIKVRPRVDSSIGIDSFVEQNLSCVVDRFERSLLTLPPSGQLFLINSVNLQNSNAYFDSSELAAGVTHILQLEVVGTRLDTYLIEFLAKTDPADDKPIIYKKSDQVIGGIEVLGVDPIASPTGTSQKLIAQIRLDSKDTSQLKTTSTLFYQVIMSHRALNEEYLVSPLGSETGTFKVIVKRSPKKAEKPDYNKTVRLNRTQISQMED